MRILPRSAVAILVLLSLHSVAFAGPLDACSEYTRYGIPSEKGDLLCRKGYALAHNPDHKTPDWVVEHLTRERASGDLKRTNDFRADADLQPGQRAELNDYKNSGFDRGHMAPAGDMAWDAEAMSQSFLLSNMSPQVGAGFNRGVWASLEGLVRLWAEKRGEVYVYTGPIYSGTPKTIGDDKVAVPTAFYKIVFDPARMEAIAFILPNRKGSAGDILKSIVRVRDVEKKTKLNFLSALPKSEQNKIETKKAKEMW